MQTVSCPQQQNSSSSQSIIKTLFATLKIVGEASRNERDSTNTCNSVIDAVGSAHPTIDELSDTYLLTDRITPNLDHQTIWVIKVYTSTCGSSDWIAINFDIMRSQNFYG